ncbi:MAG: DUF99 family protein [Candidatus Caldarchaeum sp.]|nr:DUF99 family protein [Candidatus Caldarchaeum sp.]
MRTGKKGIRCLGVAESFRKEAGSKAVIAGVVMRSDLLIDGVGITTCTVGGLDSTDSIIRMWRGLEREDINFVIVGGSVISWFNVLDLPRIHRETGLPLICLSYRESEGLDEVFKALFPDDWSRRLEIHRANGERQQLALKTGYRVYVRAYGLELKEAEQLLNKFTLNGRFPEPIRVAKLVARSILNSPLIRP